MPSKPVAIPGLELVVVLISSGDVGGEVDRWNLAGGGLAFGHTDRQQLCDVCGGHRRDRADPDPDPDPVPDGQGRVAVRREVVDDYVGDLAEPLATRMLGGDLHRVVEAGHR